MRLTLDILKEIAEKFKESGYPICDNTIFCGECVRKAIEEDSWLEDFNIIYVRGPYMSHEVLVKFFGDKLIHHKCKYTGQKLGYLFKIRDYNLILSINVFGVVYSKGHEANNLEIKMNDLLSDTIPYLKYPKKLDTIKGLNRYDSISLIRDGFLSINNLNTVQISRLLFGSGSCIEAPKNILQNQVLGLFEYKEFDINTFSMIIGEKLSDEKIMALRNLEEYFPYGERIIPRIIIISLLSTEDRKTLLDHHLGLTKTWKRDINNMLIILRNFKKYLNAKERMPIEGIGRMLKRATNQYNLSSYYIDEYLFPVIKSIFVLEDWKINILKHSIENLTIEEISLPINGKDIINNLPGIDKTNIGDVLEQLTINFDRNPELNKEKLLFSYYAL